MCAVPESRFNKGFAAPPGSASRTVQMHVFCQILQKNYKKALGCHRLSRSKPPASARQKTKSFVTLHALAAVPVLMFCKKYKKSIDN